MRRRGSPLRADARAAPGRADRGGRRHGSRAREGVRGCMGWGGAGHARRTARGHAGGLRRQPDAVRVPRRCDGQGAQAGKHVHTEKPVGLDTTEARALVQLASRSGLRLSCAPITFMGHAQQAAHRTIQDGRAGEIRLVYADVNHGRIESWHPRPEPFYAIGPLFDVGVYPLTILAAFFGPARRVTAWGGRLLPSRATVDGASFEAGAPDCIVAVLELESGPVARLTANFYVQHEDKQHGMQFHGDRGSVLLSTWQDFDADVGFAP